MNSLAPAIASVIVALIALIGVWLETTRRSINAVKDANFEDHETTMLLLKTVVRDVGGLRADVRELTNRFNDHVDK